MTHRILIPFVVLLMAVALVSIAFHLRRADIEHAHHQHDHAMLIRPAAAD